MRYRLLRCLSIAVVAASLFMSSVQAQTTKPEKLWVFVGTYTGKMSKGIYRFEMDLATGKLAHGELAAEVSSPSFLAIHPSGNYLYCVSEMASEGKQTGGVTAFALEPKTGKLTKLNDQPAGGAGPCHISVDPNGKNVLIANYGGGSVNVYPIAADGKAGASTAFIQHMGKVALPARQGGPHAHSVNVTKDNRFAMVADLGLDRVFVYKLDAEKGTLEPNDPPAYETAPGAGPRHFAFHPTAPFAFVINEIDSTLTSLKFDAKKGVLTKVQTVSTLPKGFKGNTSTAEVVVHPSGKFVYGSNRGHDSIAAFAFDDKTGAMTFVGYATEGVKEPRNFNIDPTGQYAVVASQRTNNVLVFKVDQETGALTPTGQSVEVGTPVCIKFLPIPK